MLSAICCYTLKKHTRNSKNYSIFQYPIDIPIVIPNAKNCVDRALFDWESVSSKCSDEVTSNGTYLDKLSYIDLALLFDDWVVGHFLTRQQLKLNAYLDSHYFCHELEVLYLRLYTPQNAEELIDLLHNIGLYGNFTDMCYNIKIPLFTTPYQEDKKRVGWWDKLASMDRDMTNIYMGACGNFTDVWYEVRIPDDQRFLYEHVVLSTKYADNFIYRQMTNCLVLEDILPSVNSSSQMFKNVLLSSKQWNGDFTYRKMTDSAYECVQWKAHMSKETILKERVYVDKEERGDVSISSDVVSIRGVEYPRLGRSVMKTLEWAFSNVPVRFPYTERGWLIPMDNKEYWIMSSELREIGKQADKK